MPALQPVSPSPWDGLGRKKSKNLLTGAILALTPAIDMFESICRVALVAGRPLAGLEQNSPAVDVRQSSRFFPLLYSFNSNGSHPVARLLSSVIYSELATVSYNTRRPPSLTCGNLSIIWTMYFISL